MATFRSVDALSFEWALRQLASKAKARHEKVVAFLRALRVSREMARVDAEGIEHHVSPETLAAFDRFLASYEQLVGQPLGKNPVGFVA